MKLPIGLALGALALLSLAACSPSDFVAEVLHLPATVRTAVATVQDASIPANVALVAANSFDAIEATATNVLITCTPTTGHTVPAVCASQRTNIKTMASAILAGRSIRNAIEPTSAGAQPVSKSAYDKLQAIISTLTSAVATFNAANSGS